LVDDLGSLDQAIAAAAARAGLKEGEYERDYLESEKSWARELLTSLQVKTAVALFAVLPEEMQWLATARMLGVEVDAATLSLLQGALREVGPIERELMRFNRYALPNRLYAHCFCTPL
jgi:ClpP class serine protease